MKSIPDWPRMMRRSTAAAYCDLTPSEFEREVASGRLPAGVKLGNSNHWCRIALDHHLSRITGSGAGDWSARSPLYGGEA